MPGKHRTTPAILLICVAIAVVASLVSYSGSLEIYELKMVNAQVQFRYWLRTAFKQVHVSDRVVLAGIDGKTVDPSYSDYSDRWGAGGWFTRDHWVRAVECLARYKPKVFAIDVFFSPQRTRSRSAGSFVSDSIESVEKSIRENKTGLRDLAKGESFPRLEILDVIDDSGSNTFANRFFDIEAARANGEKMPEFVIPFYFTRSLENSSQAWNLKKDAEKIARLKRQSIPPRCLANIPGDYPYADSATLPFDSLLDAPVTLGFIDVPRDPEDGNIRRVPLVNGFCDLAACKAPVFMPSISLSACLLDMGISLEALATEKPGQSASGIRVEFGKEIHLWNKDRDLHIPIDRHGFMFLNFEGKIRDFRQISFVDLIQNRNSQQVRDLLADRVVVAGVTFTGGSDVGPCAIDPNVPLAFIHMTAIDNILRQSFLRPLGPMARTGIIFVLMLLVGFINSTSRARVHGIGTFFLLLAYLLIGFLLYLGNTVTLPVVVPALAVIIAFGCISLFRYEVEQKARIEIRKKFSTMVSGDLLEQMEDNPEKLALGGERRDVTILFSDVAGFTSVAESLTPTRLVEVINTYLTPMTEIILEGRGYVNKFLGDGIMAVWGAPLPLATHAEQACRSALAQQKKIAELAPMFLEKFSVNLKVRMGLLSGPVDAGNMGSLNRFEYTVMGDTVNLAARLEPANKDYDTRIILGRGTYDQIQGKGFAVRLLDRIIVQGKTEPVEIYELMGMEGDLSKEKAEAVKLFEKGLRLHWERKWEDSLREFEECLRVNPGDGPARAFVERVRAYQKAPPPADWRGDFVRPSKN